VPGVTVDALDEAQHERGVILASTFEAWTGSRPAPRTLDELRKDHEFLDWSAMQ
jgi:hypothetical protein